VTASTRTVDASVLAWAASGAMSLSGPRPGGTTGPPERLVAGVAGLGRRIGAATHLRGARLELDWLALLGERAAIDGLTAGGRVSCGGATRLMRCSDGWFALGLGRPEDLELVPAWLAMSGATSDDTSWRGIERAARELPGAALSGAAAVLGIPVGVLDERSPDPTGGVVVTSSGGSGGPGTLGTRPLVVDLSALWAGPLCASLLAAAGADVVKVESSARPDVARLGSPSFHHLLNGRKRHRVVDLATSAGREALADLVATADVVVESSRPRALEQLGIVAERELARPDGPAIWVSITGHGRSSPRVAFGDDAAVAGGLVVRTDDGPWFCADAVADPLTGLAAAATALELLASGARAMVDVSMAGVAAAHAGPTLPADRSSLVAAQPRARGAG
jgi:hypothetical protein